MEASWERLPGLRNPANGEIEPARAQTWMVLQEAIRPRYAFAPPTRFWPKGLSVGGLRHLKASAISAGNTSGQGSSDPTSYLACAGVSLYTPD